MTQNEFVVLCVQYTIDPGIALEDDKIVKALRERDDAKVEVLLRENF